MRSITGLGLAAIGLASVAIGAVSAPAASTDKIVYHSKLPGRNNEILVVSSAGGAPTRLTRHKASDSNPTCFASKSSTTGAASTEVRRTAVTG